MKERSLAKAVGFDFGCERVPSLYGHFEYEGGGCQGFGLFVDVAFLYRFCCVFGVDRLSKVNGKSCWVTHDHCSISLIEPLHKKDGKPLDIEKWASWIKSKKYSLNVSEILDGF